MGKIGFVFSGQGAQYPGMGKELYQIPSAKKVFLLAEELYPGITDLCFNGTKEELSITKNTQPCLFTLDLACAAALEEKGIKADFAAGFSLGELAGISYCKILPFEKTFALVQERAKLMQQCAEDKPGVMAAVLRLDEITVQALCKQYDEVFPVNYNCPGQIVVSGNKQQIDKFTEQAAALKGKVIQLAVSGSFHSPFMEKASIGLMEYMSKLEFSLPEIPLYANTTALPYSDNAFNLLAEQVKSPVLWQKTIENMIMAGCTVFIELGAGKTLSGLIKKINNTVEVFNIEDSESLLHTTSCVIGRKI